MNIRTKTWVSKKLFPLWNPDSLGRKINENAQETNAEQKYRDLQRLSLSFDLPADQSRRRNFLRARVKKGAQKVAVWVPENTTRTSSRGVQETQEPLQP